MANIKQTLCLRSKRSEVRILSGVPTPSENRTVILFPKSPQDYNPPADRLPGDLSVLVPSTFQGLLVNEAAA